jgi:hypothetical protein
MTGNSLRNATLATILLSLGAAFALAAPPPPSAAARKPAPASPALDCGFYLVEAKDLDEAIKLAGGIPVVRTGSVEVRPITPTPPVE